MLHDLYIRSSKRSVASSPPPPLPPPARSLARSLARARLLFSLCFWTPSLLFSVFHQRGRCANGLPERRWCHGCHPLCSKHRRTVRGELAFSHMKNRSGRRLVCLWRLILCSHKKKNVGYSTRKRSSRNISNKVETINK